MLRFGWPRFNLFGESSSRVGILLTTRNGSVEKYVANTVGVCYKFVIHFDVYAVWLPLVFGSNNTVYFLPRLLAVTTGIEEIAVVFFLCHVFHFSEAIAELL